MIRNSLDPQDRTAAYAATARRARAIGPRVWRDPLASLDAWRQAGEAAQDVIASDVARCLGSRWRLEGMREWSCPCVIRGVKGIRIPETTLSHRLALFVHVATGAEFSLVPGEMIEEDDPIEVFVGPPESWPPAGSRNRRKVIRRLPPLLVARWPVTVGQAEAGVWSGRAVSRDTDIPMAEVSHNQVSEWCKRQGLRLPSTAEWQRAAGGGSPTRFPWGNEMDDGHCWYARNSWIGGGENHPHPPSEHDKVRAHNAFGLVDTVGNVWEWLEDGGIVGGSYNSRVHLFESGLFADVHNANDVRDIGFRPVADVPDWRE